MSYRSRTTRLVVAAATVAVLVGCGASAEPHAPPPGASAGNPSAQLPEQSVGRWSGVAFEKVMYGRLKCPDFAEAAGKAEVSATRYADLTSDGRPEAVVAGACYSSTAANPTQVLVFDGAQPGPDPSPLIAIGGDQQLIDASITLAGATVTITSAALSDEAPHCCPDLRIVQTYAWRDGAFARTGLTKGPAS